MANTGYKQATIAYKVSKPGGQPLDIDGNLISVSGNKQAIMLLAGTANPDPLTYDVEGYFNENGIVLGNPTFTFDATSCPVGNIIVVPSFLTVDDTTPTNTFKVISSATWSLTTAPAGLVTFSQTTGVSGETVVTVTRVAGANGQGDFIFTNNQTLQTATLHIASVTNASLWILEDGTWNMLGFWINDGIWNY